MGRNVNLFIYLLIKSITFCDLHGHVPKTVIDPLRRGQLLLSMLMTPLGQVEEGTPIEKPSY